MKYNHILIKSIFQCSLIFIIFCNFLFSLVCPLHLSSPLLWPCPSAPTGTSLSFSLPRNSHQLCQLRSIIFPRLYHIYLLRRENMLFFLSFFFIFSLNDQHANPCLWHDSYGSGLKPVVVQGAVKMLLLVGHTLHSLVNVGAFSFANLPSTVFFLSFFYFFISSVRTYLQLHLHHEHSVSACRFVYFMTHYSSSLWLTSGDLDMYALSILGGIFKRFAFQEYSQRKISWTRAIPGSFVRTAASRLVSSRHTVLVCSGTKRLKITKLFPTLIHSHVF